MNHFLPLSLHVASWRSGRKAISDRSQLLIHSTSTRTVHLTGLLHRAPATTHAYRHLSWGLWGQLSGRKTIPNMPTASAMLPASPVASPRSHKPIFTSDHRRPEPLRAVGDIEHLNDNGNLSPGTYRMFTAACSRCWLPRWPTPPGAPQKARPRFNGNRGAPPRGRMGMYYN